MAFSKAKLTRFNDIKTCAPPPGAYNPKFSEAIIGAVIPTSERFIDPKSPAGSTCSESNSVSSVPSVPTFRTPKKPTFARVKGYSSADKKTSKHLFSPKRSEALREKIVECMNKDMTIKDLLSQIEEMKTTICVLRQEKDKTISEKDHLLTESQKIKTEKEEEIQEVKKQYLEEIMKIQEEISYLKTEKEENNKKYEFEYEELNKKCEEKVRNIQMEIDKKIEDLQKVIEERNKRIKNLEDKLMESEQRYDQLYLELAVKNDELKILENQLEEWQIKQNSIIIKHCSEIKSLNELHESEVHDLEYELLKTREEWKKVAENIEKENKKKTDDLNKQKEIEIIMLRENCNQQIRKIQEETEAHLKQTNENCTEKIKLTEIQMEEKRRELEVDWALKLRQQQEQADEILKECQSISEYSIIQCELEKTEIANKLREEINQNTALQEIISRLKSEMSSLIVELNDTRNVLGKVQEAHRLQGEHAQIQKHSYEVTLSKTHDAINALKNRLLDSDRDVEQLKHEIENIENGSVGFENKITDLENILKKENILNQTLEIENTRLHFELEHKVKSVEQQLLLKVDTYTANAEERIENLNEMLKEKSKLLAETMDQLHDSQAAIAQAQILIENTDKKFDELTNTNKLLQVKLALQEQKSTHTHQSKINDLTKQLNNKDEEIESLKKLVKNQNELIGPFREQLEHYERDIHMLMNGKNAAEQEMKEVSLKYAEILGHQNKKQKIKYMVDLKKKNLELQEFKSGYEEKLYKQSLLIDKLKYELKSLQDKDKHKQKRRSRSLITSADKENIPSPVKTQINTSLKTDSPLKDRN